MSEPVVFGRYLLLERIAAGGMAEVFKAKSYGVAGFEKLLVIKKILPHLSQNERFVTMFIKEAKIAVNLNHKNVVQVFDLGKVADDYYIAMEYVHGKDLREITRACAKKRIPLPLSLACYLLAEIAAGLDYAHRRKDLDDAPLNIIHMDISPQNVLVSFEGDVKIADFGIAHAVGGDGKMKGGVLRGKYAYMSPEMALGKPVDQRTDIFSAGVILHELITGRRLFYESDEVRTIENVRKCIVPPPSSINPQVPLKLEQVTLKALCPDPDKRYQTAEELRADLTEVLFGFSRVVDVGDLARFFRKVFAKDALPAPGVNDIANLISDLSRLGARPIGPIGQPPPAQPPADAPSGARSVVQTVVKAPSREVEEIERDVERKIADEPTLDSVDEPLVAGPAAERREVTDPDAPLVRGHIAIVEAASESSRPAIPAEAMEVEVDESSNTGTGTSAAVEVSGPPLGMIPETGEATESSAIPLSDDDILVKGTLPARRTVRPTAAQLSRREVTNTGSRQEARGRLDFTVHAGATPSPEISITGERKRVAILAVRFFDGGRPVKPTEPRVGEVSAILRRFGGTPVPPKADLLLAYFGVPVAQEDDLGRAIGAAHEALRLERRAAARMEITSDGKNSKVRGIAISLHHGTVAVESPAAVAGMGGRIAPLGPPVVTGTPIVVAERLARTASIGQVVASRSVVKGAHRRWDFVRIDPDVDKETGMTLERHELAESKAGPRRSEDPTPLVGRTREVGILTGVLAKIQRGHGQVLSMIGEAGSGKTRLVRELARVVADKELGYFAARAAPFGAEGDYALIGELIASIVGFHADDSLEDRREKLMRLHELGLEKHEVHFVGELAGTRFDGSGIDAFDPQARRLGMFSALRKAVERLAKERPLILVFEDLQHADPLSRDALEFLLDAVPERRLLVILTYRPEFKHRWWDRAWYNQIVLKPLPVEDSLALARACFAAGAGKSNGKAIEPSKIKLPKKLGAVIQETAGGNPMFIEELCGALVRTAKVSIDSTGLLKLGADVRRLEVPPTLRATIAARIDRLNPELKRLMQMASVLGRKFPYRALAELAGMGERVDGALVELQRAGFLVEQPEAEGELSYAFRHPMMREVAYHALPTTARRKLHRTVAEYLVRTAPEGQFPLEALALHYEQAEDVDRAVDHLEKAGDKQVNEFRDADALAYWRRARDLLAKNPELENDARARLAGLGLKIGRIAARLGWMREAEEALLASDSLSRELADQSGRAWALKELGELFRANGAYDRAGEALAEAVRLADRAEDARLKFEILEAQGNLLAWTGRADSAERELKRALNEARKLKDSSLVGRILSDLGVLQRRGGHYEAAREYLLRAEDMARRSDDKFLLSRVLDTMGSVSAAMNLLDDAQLRFKEALELARTIGDQRGEAYALHNLGAVALKSGDLSKARYFFSESDQIAQAIGWKSGELLNRVFLAWLRTLDGAAKDGGRDGRGELETVVSDATKAGARDAVARGKFFLARLTSDSGEKKRARALFEESRILAEEIGNRPLMAEIDAAARA